MKSDYRKGIGGLFDGHPQSASRVERGAGELRLRPACSRKHHRAVQQTYQTSPNAPRSRKVTSRRYSGRSGQNEPLPNAAMVLFCSLSLNCLMVDGPISIISSFLSAMCSTKMQILNIYGKINKRRLSSRGKAKAIVALVEDGGVRSNKDVAWV